MLKKLLSIAIFTSIIAQINIWSIYFIFRAIQQNEIKKLELAPISTIANKNIPPLPDILPMNELKTKYKNQYLQKN